MVKDIFPGGNSGVMDTYSEKYFSHIGDTLYFAAKDNNSGSSSGDRMVREQVQF